MLLVEISAEKKGHINNLYNTTFWALIQRGKMDAIEAEKFLKVSSFSPTAIIET